MYVLFSGMVGVWDQVKNVVFFNSWVNSLLYKYIKYYTGGREWGYTPPKHSFSHALVTTTTRSHKQFNFISFVLGSCTLWRIKKIKKSHFVQNTSSFTLLQHKQSFISFINGVFFFLSFNTFTKKILKCTSYKPAVSEIKIKTLGCSCTQQYLRI